jgi:chemotaxis response regulator CheB
MLILLISDNPLFSEVIIEALSSSKNMRIEVAGRDHAHKKIQKLKPEVLILDETLAQENLEKLLKIARDLPRARIILVNTHNNIYIMLDSACGMFQKSDDLIEAVGTGGIAGKISNSEM